MIESKVRFGSSRSARSLARLDAPPRREWRNAVELDLDRLGRIRLEAERVEQARRGIDRHHIDRASEHRGAHRERGADSSLADAAGTEADDESLRAQVERLAMRISDALAPSAARRARGRVSSSSAAADRRREHHWEIDRRQAGVGESRRHQSRLFVRGVSAYRQARVAAERTHRGEFRSVEEQIGDAVHYRGDGDDAEPLANRRGGFERLAHRKIFRRRRDDRAEAGRVAEKAVDRIGQPIQRAGRRDSLHARRDREQLDRAARGGRVDHEIAIFERRVARHDPQTFQQQERLETRQRGRDVAESAAAEHPARDCANRHDALDERLELGARRQRDHVERVGDFNRGRIVRHRAERRGRRQPPVQVGERGRTPARQRKRNRGGDRTLAGAPFAGYEQDPRQRHRLECRGRGASSKP